jgi:hypothetical protein
MKITTQLITRAILAFGILLLSGNMLSQDVFEDDFSTAHNYVADSVAGTIWDGYMLNSGADATQDAELFAMNTTDVPGSLYIRASNTDFENAEDDGAFLYKIIDADMNFDISVMIGPNSNFSSFDGVIYYNAGGLMVKHPATDSVDFLNVLAFDMPGWGAVHLVKGVNGGDQEVDFATAAADSIEANPWMRITREGYKFTTYYGPDGVTWTEINSMNRFDLLGTPLLVGIAQATFSDDTAYVEFDNLTIITSPLSSTYDGFDVAHDYLADSTDDTFWDGYMLNSGVNATQDAELFTMNTTDVPGSLIIEASNTDWEWTEDDGAFLYKIVGSDQDFDMSVMIGPNSNFSSLDGVIYYNAGGLMVKTTYNEDVDFLNLLAFDMPGWGAVHLVKNVDGGEQDETATAAADSIEANPWLRIKKSGYKFTAYWGPDGQEWNEILTVTREDMMMTELLVGIAQATFSNDTAYVEYDHFQLLTQDMDLTEEEFDMTHDFIADSTEGTIWDGYMLNSGVNETQDAELFKMNTTDIAGSLFIEASNTDWENNEDDGAFLYQIVDGNMDFDMIVAIGPNSNFSSFDGVIYYNAGGLMVKHPEADSVDFLNLLAFDMPGWGAVHLIKSVDGGDQIVDFANADADSIEANPWLRIQKTGSVFSCYYGSDIESWTKIFTTIREDLSGTPLLVGIAQATFSDDTAYVEYENFMLLLTDPDQVPPTEPGAPEASNITTTSIDLEWEGSWDNLEMWNYDVLQDGVVISTQDTLELSVTDLEPNTQYTFMVIARDASGNIAESEPLVVTTLETGVPILIESGNFAMYPNPATDVIMIEMNTSDLADINVYNIQGKLVFSNQFTERITLNKSQLGNSGFYIVRISTEGSVYSRKLIIR